MKTKESTKEFIKRKNEEFKKGKLISMKDIGRKGRFYFKREDWTFMPQSNLKDVKVFVLERLRKIKKEGRLRYAKTWKVGDIEYRIAYWIIGAKGSWKWGQFCPLIPQKDLVKLINKAKRNGVII